MKSLSRNYSKEVFSFYWSDLKSQVIVNYFRSCSGVGFCESNHRPCFEFDFFNCSCVNQLYGKVFDLHRKNLARMDDFPGAHSARVCGPEVADMS